MEERICYVQQQKIHHCCWHQLIRERDVDTVVPLRGQGDNSMQQMQVEHVFKRHNNDSLMDEIEIQTFQVSTEERQRDKNKRDVENERMKEYYFDEMISIKLSLA